MTSLLLAGVIPAPALVRDLRRPRGERLELTNAVVVIDPARMRAFDIPAGFRLDGHSAPRPARALFSEDTLGDRAALAHDWLYRHGGRLPCGTVYTRAEADCLYRDLLAADGVGRVRRHLAYGAVRAGGWASWARSPAVPAPCRRRAPAR